MALKRKLYLVLMAAALHGSAIAAPRDPDVEILVLLRNDALNLPSATYVGPGNAAHYRSEHLRAILVDPRVAEISRAFPRAVRGRSKKILPDGRLIHFFDYANIYRLRVSRREHRDAVLRMLRDDASVLVAEPNQRVELLGVPNDPYFTKQWNLLNTGQFGGKPGADVRAVGGWDKATGYGLVRIGIADEGVDALNPDFTGRVTGSATTHSAHGTAVAGIAAATGNNGSTIAGLAWSNPIISEPIDVLDFLTTAAAIRELVDQGCQVINASWNVQSESNFVGEAIAYAHQHNVLVVGAMPSSGGYPTRWANMGVMGVASTRNTDAPSIVQGGYEPFVHVSAPGAAQQDPADAKVPSLEVEHGDYQTFVGTSYAAPHVTGAAALLKGYAMQNGYTLYGKDLRGIIIATADDVGPTGYDNFSGHGRINVRRMLDTFNDAWRAEQSHVGGQSQGPSPLFTMEFYNVPGLGGSGYNGTYQVEAYEVRYSVSSSVGAGRRRHVWGLGSSTGYPGIDPNAPETQRRLYNTGFSEPVDVTASGYVMQTFVYKVWDIVGGEFKGWFPCEPHQVVYRWREWQPVNWNRTAIDPTMSYFLPEAGDTVNPDVGSQAIQFFRTCPNNDGGTSLPNSARLRIVARDSQGFGISGIDPADIFLLFNGGTSAQGFSGTGADSIIANRAFNPQEECPDVRTVYADGPTDANGVTYLTFEGASPGARGIGARDPNRKWGHYDSKIPVFVLGTEVDGRLTASDPNGSYVLQLKNYDYTGGLGTGLNQGEVVTSTDFNGVANNIGVNNAMTWWRDFDSVGGTSASDFNQISQHNTHDCNSPFDDE